MNKTISPNGWTVKQGLAAQYAAQAGIDPELGAQAGEAGWDVLRATRAAVDEADPRRNVKLARRAFERLNRAGIGRHRELVDQITAVLNEAVQSNERPGVNPQTGLQEFSVESADEGGNRQYPTGIEVFPVTGVRPPPPPMIGPPAIPIQPNIGPPPLTPASEIQDPPGLWSNNYLPEEITVKGSRYDAIMNDLQGATDESLLWATNKAKEDLIAYTGVPLTIAAIPTFARNTARTRGVNLAVGGLSALGLGWPRIMDLNAIGREMERRNRPVQNER